MQYTKEKDSFYSWFGYRITKEKLGHGIWVQINNCDIERKGITVYVIRKTKIRLYL